MQFETEMWRLSNISLDSKYEIDPAAGNNEAVRGAADEDGEYWQICEWVEVVEYLMELDSKYGIDRSIGQDFLSIFHDFY